jgi:hypothetical protein
MTLEPLRSDAEGLAVLVLEVLVPVGFCEFAELVAVVASEVPMKSVGAREEHSSVE